METIGSKPTGRLGMLAGKIMNKIHSSAYRKIIKNHIMDCLRDSDDNTVLDIGCGGGIAVKLYAGLSGIKKVTGIDYSQDMVLLSRKVNRKKRAEGSVEIKKADVSELPFTDNSFDVASAFDTVNFWPDHKKAISEILRVLKPGGAFCIINAYPKEGSKWYEFVKFKNDNEYIEYLEQSGIKDVHAVIEKNTVIVWGRK